MNPFSLVILIFVLVFAFITYVADLKTEQQLETANSGSQTTFEVNTSGGMLEIQEFCYEGVIYISVGNRNALGISPMYTPEGTIFTCK